MRLYKARMILPLLVKLGLDNDDADFLEWFHTWIKNGGIKSKFLDGKTYYLIHDSKIREDCPLIKLSGIYNVRRFLRRLERKGFIERYKLSYHHPYYHLTTLACMLFIDEHQDKQALHEELTRLYQRINKVEKAVGKPTPNSGSLFRSRFPEFGIPES